MQSCDLQLQAAVAGNTEQADMFSAKSDDLMAEYEQMNESLMEMLKGEKVWADMVAQCFSSRTPPTLPTPNLRASVGGRDDARPNAAPNVWPKEEERLTEITDGRRQLTLEWYTNNSRRRARVIVIDPLGNPLESTWPGLLSLELVQPATSINRFLTWMKESTKETTTSTGKTIEPVAGRFRPASEADMPNFAQLVNFLRDGKCNAAASWTIRGKFVPTRNLLLAPLGQDLLCAAFPVSGLPGLPQALGHQPQLQAHMGFDN
ncbi:hypothetical protein BJV78DRAFT_1283645 [Lactifluus subvellereus]|nr:hypothetical protein BJV78DRAFT_1283645 [Lactifluus subvellereus]